MLIEPKTPSDNMPTDNKVVEITASQALWVVAKSILSGKIPTNVILILCLVGYVSYDQLVTKATPSPSPNPVPAPSPIPNQKTLADLVGPEARPLLASFYHAMATSIYNDKGRVENKNEKPVLKTIGDFYEMQKEAFQIFQTSTNITGVAAINEPISMKLKTATGSLDQDKSLDDPATRVRDSLVAACKQISVEFDDRYLQIPVGKFK